MYKEFKSTIGKVTIDLDKVISVTFDEDIYNETKKYNTNITLVQGGYVSIKSSQDKQEVLDSYSEICKALKENKEKSDTEKRLKAYIENIENQVAKEVKKYLDGISKK